MEAGSSNILQQGGRVGAWYTYNDGTVGATQTPMSGGSSCRRRWGVHQGLRRQPRRDPLPHGRVAAVRHPLLDPEAAELGDALAVGSCLAAFNPVPGGDWPSRFLGRRHRALLNRRHPERGCRPLPGGCLPALRQGDRLTRRCAPLFPRRFRVIGGRRPVALRASALS